MVGAKMARKGSPRRNRNDKERSGRDYGRECFAAFSLTINQISTIMKQRIILHLTMLAVLVPCMMVFNSSNSIWVNVIGIIYCCYLAIVLNESDAAKRFVRRYYHEILRLGNMM